MQFLCIVIMSTLCIHIKFGIIIIIYIERDRESVWVGMGRE